MTYKGKRCRLTEWKIWGKRKNETDSFVGSGTYSCGLFISAANEYGRENTAGKGTGKSHGTKIDLRDVAQLAGLSAGTVSKYLNHPESVQEKNRKKIEKAIRLLNYTPNVLARKLASGRSRVLGLCIVTEPEISDSTWLHLLPMIQTLNDSACQAGYQLQIGLSSVGREEQTLQMLRDGAEGKGMDGLFLVSAWEVPEDLIRYLLNREFPFVLVENHSRCLENRQFYFDNYGIGVSCTEYLFWPGHREIGFFHAGGRAAHGGSVSGLPGYAETSEAPLERGVYQIWRLFH